MKIDTVAQIAKAMSIKREKDEDGDERVIVHLKFGGLVLTREQVNAIAGQREGWCETSFFDELGAPFGPFVLGVDRREWTVTGTIKGPRTSGIKLTEAVLSGISFAFAPNEVRAAGQLTWQVAGDEASDAEPLLGRACAIAWVVQDGGQEDAFRKRAA